MKKNNYHLSVTLLLITLLLLPLPVTAAPEITIAAANSTCPTLKKAGEIFSRQRGVTVHYICKSSGALAKGLESSYITADYYISASQKWMDYLVSSELISKDAITPLWANKIIAATPKGSPLELQSWDELATPKISTILVGDPSTTPNGRRFKKAMRTRGLWEQVRSKIIIQRHMSLISKTLLSADNKTIGIMFPTSLTSGHKILLNMPQEWHTPIHYYTGQLLKNKNKEVTTSFDNFLKTNEIKQLFNQGGYIILP